MTDRTNFEMAHAYLVGLYGSQPQGLIWIGGHADGFRGRTFSEPADAARYAIALDGKGESGVYHRSTTLTAPVGQGRGTVEETSHVYYFALDVDVRGPGHKAENLPANLEDAQTLIWESELPEPSLWVASGGGFYPQWRFDEPIDVRDGGQRAWVAEVFSRLSAHCIEVAERIGWRLDNVRDLARIFRMPGTTNRKTDPVPCTAGQTSDYQRYDIGELAAKVRPRTSATINQTLNTIIDRVVADDGLFEDPPRLFTEEQAKNFIREARARLAETQPGGYNVAINAFAMACAHFPWLVNRAQCAAHVIKALGPSTGWTAADADDERTIDSAYTATEAGRSWIAVRVDTPPDDKRLKISSAADMAYWLREEAGRGRLSSLFLRNGRVVHTPRIGQAGYVPAPEGENGPAEIRPITGPVLASKIQYAYDCYKLVEAKDGDGKRTGDKTEVAAMFPIEAASRAVDSPEALRSLRPLRGITSTPMVRGDGSLLADPGYDSASGYLFLPEDGIAVPAVPDRPGGQEVAEARDMLMMMIQDFPFAGDDDRANYIGLLLTPLLRQVVPPSYKLFGIGAHQPGSGKSLLAEIAGIIHGAVMRSEVPEDEAEWRKQSISILSTTSAPLVILDNIMGVLKSSTLAGLITAGREVTDREMGKNTSTITVANDRVWVVTGNNLSLGGDMVRRTVTILIDPDQPNPEQRTDFAIADLKGWVTQNRNQILWALLVLIRGWVTAGMPEPERRQSDSFARWSRVIAGVLAVAGIDGTFDADSGQRAAGGGDDDGLAQVLEVLRDRFSDRRFTVGEALEPKEGDGWLIESRDWLPSVVLDRLARSEAAGRRTFARWLLNRLGRWVTTPEGRPLVLREDGRDKRGALWWVQERL